MGKDGAFKVHSIKYNLIMNIILRMSTFLFPLITFPYVSRVLGAEGNGKIAFASSFVSYFTMVAQLGIPTYGIRTCARCRDDKEELSRTVHELFIIGSIVMMLSYIVMASMIWTVPRLQEDKTILWIFSISIILSNVGMGWFYQAIEQYDYITLRNLLFKVLSIVLMFLFVKKKEDYVIYAGITVLGTVGSNILNLLRMKKYIYIHPLDKYRFFIHIKPILVFFMFSVATTIYTSMDTVMLGFLASDTQVGYYAAATKMKNILVSLVTALGAVLLPRASYYIENNMREEFGSIIRKSFQFVIAIALPLCIYFMLEASDTIYFLAGNEYKGAIPSTIIITPTILLIGLSYITGMQILIPLGLEKYTVISTIAGAVVDLIVNFLFIPRIGAAGAALGTLSAELTVLLIQLVELCWLQKKEYLRLEWLDVLKIVFANMVAIIVLIGTKRLITINGYFIRLFISAILYFSVYGVLLIIMKESLIYRYLTNTMLRRVKQKK